MNKLEQTKKKGTNTLIALAVIAVAVYVGFTPLYELIGGGVAGAVIGSSFGAIFVIVLTMYLLNKQTEIEQESKKSERIFEKKIELYDKLINQTEAMLDDGKISADDEMKKLPFVLIRLQMLGNDEAIKAYTPIYKEINKLFDNQPDDDEVAITPEARGEIMSALSNFSRKCRVDLGVLDVDIDNDLFKETKEIIEHAGDIATGRRRGKTQWTSKEKWFQELTKGDWSPELIQSIRKFYDKLTEKYGNSEEFFIDTADFTLTQSNPRLSVKSGAGVFCDITLRKTDIYIRNIYKSPRWDYKQLEDEGGKLFFQHYIEDPRKLKIVGITQIDEGEMEKILVVLGESKKVLEEKDNILPNYKKLAKEGDEAAKKEHVKHTADDYTLRLNISNE